MSRAARQEISVFRNDPMCLLLEVVGEDLTGAAFAFAVRLYPDAAGAALLGPLAATATKGAPGVRLVRVDVVDDVPVSLLEIIDTKAHVQALPAATEAGADLTLHYDFGWTPLDDGSGLAAVEVTRLFGSFVVKGSVNG